MLLSPATLPNSQEFVSGDVSFQRVRREHFFCRQLAYCCEKLSKRKWTLLDCVKILLAEPTVDSVTGVK